MPRRTRARFAKLLMPFLLLVNMPAGVEAGLMIKIWQLKETADAPVLVVGRVLAVQKGERVADGSLPWKAETWAMTADVQVLRSYAASEPVAVSRLQVHFLAYGPSVTAFISGSPPLPTFDSGQVLILPLQENKNPTLEPWRLTADSGARLTIPSLAGLVDSRSPPGNARAFLFREIANSLSRGTPREVSNIASYLADQHDDLTGELMPLLESAIGEERQRWAEVAADLLAAQGIPRPATTDLISAKVERKDWPLRPSFFLAQAVLQKLQAPLETETLLIETWIANAPLTAWGSANSLLEYADHPVTTEALRRALQNDLAGSSYIAWTLARNGHQATLPEARARAIRVVDRPESDSTDLQGAAALLRDYGSDRELKQLAALVRKYQTADRKFYSVLWQYATESGNPREVRVLAVVLRDRRTVSEETRYCDFAVGVLEKAVGQHFRAAGKTLKERDDAVSQALAWIEAQGISN